MISPLHISPAGDAERWHESIVRGPAAIPLVARDRDMRERDGVLRVTPVRWMLAQQYERAVWTGVNGNMDDDRGPEHAARFAHYSAIAGHEFPRAIEVGCGPFTQLGHILKAGVRAGAITLADPLIDVYLNEVRHCAYARGRWDARLAAVSIESAPSLGTFELVVSINVLQHCADYPAAMAALRALLAPGGILVFSEPSVRRDMLDEVLESVWDAGHPLMVADDRLRADVEAMGRVVFGRVFEGVVEEQPWRRDHYFIIEAPVAKICVAYRAVPRSPGRAVGDSVCRAVRMLGHEAVPLAKFYERDEWVASPLVDVHGRKKHQQWHQFDGDLVIQLECNDNDPQYDLRAMKCPRVYWEFDTAMHVPWTRQFIEAMGFARVYMANRRLVAGFNAAYLPFGIDPVLYGPMRASGVEPQGAACIGSTFPERVAFCEAAGVPLVTGVYNSDYVRALSSLKVSVHNHSSGGDGLIVNRPWETMAVGTCLLAEFDPALDAHFTAGIHYAEYHTVEDCCDKIEWLLAHDDERQTIARNGHDLVHREHTYAHRIATILKDMGL